MMKSSKKLNHRKYLISILLLALVLRLWGIWHGYPYSFYPDEAHFVKRALAFGSGDLNPHWFHKPAFFMYQLFFEYGLFFIFGKIIGIWDSVNGFAVNYILNPGPFYIIGRITVTFFSLGTVVVTYLIGKTLFRKRVGLIAALLLALSFGHVMISKDIKADMPCVFFTVVSAWCLTLFFRENKTKYIILASVFAGVGAATKTYSLVMMAPIILSCLLGAQKKVSNSFPNQIMQIGICMMVFIASYFSCSPYSFIDPLGRKSTLAPIYSLSSKINIIVSGAPLDSAVIETNVAQNIVNPENSFSVYLASFFSYLSLLIKGLGWITILTAGFGIPYLFLKGESRVYLGLLMFPLTFALLSIVVHPGYSDIRHQAVIYPFLTVISASFIGLFVDRIHGKWRWLFICILLYPMVGIVKYDMQISGRDTRNVAKQWIEATIPAGTKIVIDEDGPVLAHTAAQINALMTKADSADPNGQFTAHYDDYLVYQLQAANKQTTYHIDEMRFPWWQENEVADGVHELNSDFDKDMGNPLKLVGVHEYQFYQKAGYIYAVVNSNRYKAFLSPDSKLSKNFPSFHRFYSELFAKGKLIKEFIPVQGRINGPVVKIFQMG